MRDAPIAALLLFHFGEKSYYLYGMSTEQRRELMPNYLLQWEAIKLSKRLGCGIYDPVGAPDVFDETDRMGAFIGSKMGWEVRLSRPLAHTTIQPPGLHIQLSKMGFQQRKG